MKFEKKMKKKTDWNITLNTESLKLLEFIYLLILFSQVFPLSSLVILFFHFESGIHKVSFESYNLI